MRPVFSPVQDGVSSVMLPPAMNLDQALEGLVLMLKQYQPGHYVFEETWVNRLGGVAPDHGDLTDGEVAAIVAGDTADRHVRGMRIQRFLWRVARLGRGRTIRIRHGDSLSRWTAPVRVMLTRCDRPSQAVAMSIDEVGIRFSRPYEWPLASNRSSPQHKVDALTAAYCRRLDAATSAAGREQAERDWRLLWLQLLLGSSDDPLGWWTRRRPQHDFIPLLTLTASSSASALTWWGDQQSWAVEVEEEESDETTDAACAPAERCPYVLTRDPKMLVPRSAMWSLSRFLGAQPAQPTPCPLRPVAARTDIVRLEGAPQPNPYELFRRAAGGQGVELRTLASYLGSSAHLAAMWEALVRHNDLPTALLEAESGGMGRWSTLARYVAQLPPVTQELGRVLMAGLEDDVAAVEFPVYWCGLTDEHRFVYSRIDAITRSAANTYDVWEFKTRWGRCTSYEQRPLLQDLRQAALCCCMLRLQTGVTINKLHLRYAGVAPDGHITRVTHTFDAPQATGFMAHALQRTRAYTDAELALVDAAQLNELAQVVAGAPLPTTMPAYQILKLIDATPLLRMTPAAARQLPGSPWLEHVGTRALWIQLPSVHRIRAAAPNRHVELDAAIKARGVDLARGVTTRRLPKTARVTGPSVRARHG